MSIRFVLALTAAIATVATLIACGEKKAAAPAAAVSPAVAAASSSPAPGPTPTQAAYAAPGPATFTVIGGRNEGPIDIEQFMPYLVHVREGDTVEWKSSGIESHTITFASVERQREILTNFLVPDPEDPEQQLFNVDAELPTDTGDTFDGGTDFVSSGSIGAAVEGTYRLTFTRRGVYQYVCLIHPFWMRGVVSVDAPDAQVEAPESVSARGKADFDRFVAEEKRALAQASELPRNLPGPGGTRVHRVAVGLTTPYGQAAYFVPAKLDVKTGDTVIFENDERDFHNVIFKGSRDAYPPGIVIRGAPGGRGIIFGLSKESARAVDPPADGFDPSTYLSSGSMGILLPRQTWRLTFDKPGTYLYNCTMHALSGMGGVIIVTPRSR